MLDQVSFEEFDWDPFKDALNQEKHGIDFMSAALVFEGRILVREDDRHDYGEVRYIVIGVSNGLMLSLVVTVRGTVLRIISARRANKDERYAYGRHDPRGNPETS